MELKFKTEEELLNYIRENYSLNDIFDMSEIDDSDLENEVESRGNYYFEDEYDIKNYVEDDMDCYVFDRPSEIEDWVKMNGNWPVIFENHKSQIASNYREETLDLIERLSEEKGWEWIYEKLTNC